MLSRALVFIVKVMLNWRSVALPRLVSFWGCLVICDGFGVWMEGSGLDGWRWGGVMLWGGDGDCQAGHGESV